MTAHAMKGDRERCLAAGMDGYVSKPLRPQELFEVLEDLPAAAVAGPAAAGSTSEPAVFDRAAALDRVDGDVELMKELAGLFLDECPQRMAEIREAIIRRDATKLQQAAHTLKGSVGNFGAAEAIEAARRLETDRRKSRTGSTRRRPGPRWRRRSIGLKPAMAEALPGDGIIGGRWDVGPAIRPDRRGDGRWPRISGRRTERGRARPRPHLGSGRWRA